MSDTTDTFKEWLDALKDNTDPYELNLGNLTQVIRDPDLEVVNGFSAIVIGDGGRRVSHEMVDGDLILPTPKAVNAFLLKIGAKDPVLEEIEEWEAKDNSRDD